MRHRWTARTAAAFLAGVMVLVLLPMAGSIAEAQEAPEQFTLDLVGGTLQLRDAEPYELANPTSLSGTNDDGQLTDVVFETPRVTIEQDVPAFNTTATIHADFSMVGPGTGSVGTDGHVTVQLAVAVDLHIIVPILADPRDCRAAPINLTLTSTAPYDEEQGQVTLVTPNFTIPPVAPTSTPFCDDLIAGPVNDALAGSGHSLSLTLAGPLTVPTEGEPTTTTLAIAPPSGTAAVGDEVTLTATVVPDPEVPGAPPVTGTVSFFDGATLLGTAPVDEDSTAQLVTTALGAGERTLRAAYSGAAPDWDPSSETVTYRVVARPGVTTTLAGTVTTGEPRDFGVTVVNTGLGSELEGARLDVEIHRQTGNAPIGPDGDTPRIVLSRVVDGEATPVELTLSGTGSAGNPWRLNGTVGDAGTWDVAPGAEHTEDLRLEVAPGTGFGPLVVTFTLVVADVERAEGAGVVTIVAPDRRPSTVESGAPGIVIPGDPPIVLVPPTPEVTPVVRQGNTAEMGALRVEPLTVSGIRPTGTFRFLIDGVPVPGMHIHPPTPGADVWLDPVPVTPASTYFVKVPATIPIGTRQVTVQYSGDAHFEPSQGSWPITIEPSIGTVYECVGQGLSQGRFTANLEVQADLPTLWPAGRDLPVDRVQARLRYSRTITHSNALVDVVADHPSRDLALGLDPDGTIAPADLTLTDSTPMYEPDDGLGIDVVADLTGGTGTLAIDHAPGDAVDYTLATIVATTSASNFLTGIRCTPEVDTDPYQVGSVTAAGTTLAVDPAGPVGPGTAVTLTATALPVAAGFVEFRDGGTTLGVGPVNSAGVATMTTTLPAGTRTLDARFFGGLVATRASLPVEIRVIGDCPANLDPGNGAAVRLVYLELLDRCPDQAGYTYWTGQLDAEAVTREEFASQISGSLEAREVIVEDAYQTILGRPAEPQGRRFWAQRLGTTAGYDQLLASLATTGTEFDRQAGGTDPGFVDLVYERLLLRAPDPTGRAFWVDYVQRNGRSRLVRALFDLPEPTGRIIIDAYQDLLDRDPTPGELSAGITVFTNGKDRSVVYASIIGTEEFFGRAQDFPERP